MGVPAAVPSNTRNFEPPGGDDLREIGRETLREGRRRLVTGRRIDSGRDARMLGASA